MRARREWTLVPAVLAALSAAACVSLPRSPEARYFALRPVATQDSGPAAEASGLVGLLPVRLPEHLLRPQLVTWTGPSELRLEEFLRWSEPLDEAAARTLADDLSFRLPRARVARWPWPASARPRCRVVVEVRRFGAEPSGAVGLEGTFLLLAAREEVVLAQRPFDLRREAVGPGGPGAVVEAMSALLGELAGQIASEVAALPEPAGAN